MTLSHAGIWTAIDTLASRNNLSTSGLARRAGLDPTTFNKSKRHAADGRARWPSTELIAKILDATGAELDEFLQLFDGQAPEIKGSYDSKSQKQTVPLLGFAEAGNDGFFDDAGFPAKTGLDEIILPTLSDDNAYALKISGDSMLPLYRDGDIIILSPEAQSHPGNRVVVRTLEGEVMAKTLMHKTHKTIKLSSLNPNHEDRILAMSKIDWITRIIWASQ